MLEQLHRSAVQQILVISPNEEPIPPDLNELWSTGFKCLLTIVSPAPSAHAAAEAWTIQNRAVTTLVSTTADIALTDLLSRYEVTFPDQRRVVRVRDVNGDFRMVDVTAADEPERPILGQYDLIEERNLHLLSPGELGRDELIQFFQDSTTSWRPYAAGLPWNRETDAQIGVLNYLRRLDADGAEANRILYVASERGAGGTTLARSMAFACAREGYPVLLTRQNSVCSRPAAGRKLPDSSPKEHRSSLRQRCRRGPRRERINRNCFPPLRNAMAHRFRHDPLSVSGCRNCESSEIRLKKPAGLFSCLWLLARRLARHSSINDFRSN